MIKIYSGRTGEYVDTFRLPTVGQLRAGHPNLKQMITALNAKGFCTKSQLLVLQKKAKAEAEAAYLKECEKVAKEDDAKERWDEMTTAEKLKLEEQ